MVETIKVVLTGSCATGKTSIINRLVFDNFQEAYESTEGGACGQKTFYYPGKTLAMDVWDTAGQEKYRSLTKIFYKDASIAILVYDIARRETFEEIKTYWITQLTQFGKNDLILGIAGNKCDKFDKEQVSDEEGRAFAKEVGAVFKLTSAFLNIGINDLFEELGKKYISRFNHDIDEATNSRQKVVEKEVILDEKKAKKIVLESDGKKGAAKKKKGCC